MEDEIIEALLDEHEDDEDMLGYCLSYLREICADTKKGINLAWRCNEAINIGFYPKDLFILLAKNRLVADWQVKNQKNARKYHSYFWVFEKSSKRIEYI